MKIILLINILLQREKNSVKVYLDLLDRTSEDYKMNHLLSHILTEKIREFGWTDMDYTREADVKSALQQYSKVKFQLIL